MDRLKIVGLACLAVFAMAMIGGKHQADQYSKAYGFRVEIADLEPIPVRVVEGISLKRAVMEVEVPGEEIVRKIPGRLKYSDITLKRGYLNDPELFDFLDVLRMGPVDRHDVKVTILDRAGNDVRTVNYTECFLSGYSLAPLDGSKGVGTRLEEEITFSCDLILAP